MARDYAEQTVPEVCELIEKSPTAYHVVKNASEIIDAEILHEKDSFWDIDFGKTYMVVRNDSSAIFLNIPEDLSALTARFEIAAVHSDSPGYVVKHDPIIVRDGYVILNVEEYGGPLRKTWFDRPLSIAGRVIAKNTNTNEISTYLVNLSGRIDCVIPTLAPHMGSDDTDEVSVQSTMLPVIGNDDVFSEPEDALMDAIRDYLKENYGVLCEKQNIIDHDLFVYCAQAPASSGIGHMICAPRLDDQGSVWSSVIAFADMLEDCDWKTDSISVLAIFDNEENGSGGYHAASSTFLLDVLKRVWDSLALKAPSFAPDWFEACLARSFMVSADNGHAHHPNYIAKGDITNPVVCGRGIVLKYSADQNYMTGARTGASFKVMCDEENIPYQPFHKNSDVRGGKTLGNISTTQVSVPGCDIGLPQLAMHSAYEYCATADIVNLARFFRDFFAGARDVNITTDDIICY